MNNLMFILCLCPALSFASISIQDISYVLGKTESKNETVAFLQEKKIALENEDQEIPDNLDKKYYLKGRLTFYTRLLSKVEDN